MQPSQAEKNTFGEDCKLHPITRMPLEQGSGARSVDEQAEMHLARIEHEQGKDVANAMRHKMRAQTDMQEANSELVSAEHHHEEDI